MEYIYFSDFPQLAQNFVWCQLVWGLTSENEDIECNLLIFFPMSLFLLIQYIDTLANILIF